MGRCGLALRLKVAHATRPQPLSKPIHSLGRPARSRPTIRGSRPSQKPPRIVEARDAWLNPPGLSDKELQKRTLTNLYNERPGWLDSARRMAGWRRVRCLRMAA